MRSCNALLMENLMSLNNITGSVSILPSHVDRPVKIFKYCIQWCRNFITPIMIFLKEQSPILEVRENFGSSEFYNNDFRIDQKMPLFKIFGNDFYNDLTISNKELKAVHWAHLPWKFELSFFFTLDAIYLIKIFKCLLHY